MKVEDSKYILLKHTKISLPIGKFYFFENFIITEISEGVHYTWKEAKGLIEIAHKHYGVDTKVTYISNRINSYSLDAQDWVRFYKNYDNIDTMIIVAYSKIGIMNIVLEKLFSRVPIKRFNTLEKAVTCAQNLNVEKEVI